MGSNGLTTSQRKSATAAYKKAFIQRTKQAREASKLTQAETANLLGIPQDHYKQYETRSMLPRQLIPPFCAIMRVTELWLLAGRDRHRSSRQ
jgi:transcriptional regulator with XRE-family HTH domain